MEPPGPVRCLRCGSTRVDAAAAARAAQVCPHCGFQLPADAAAQLDYLDSLEAWIGVRRAEVIGAALVPPAPGGSASTPDTVGAAPSGSRATAAGCLLTVGAFALVTAGLAFTAFAWDLLGPLGQLLVLVVVGIAAMAGGWSMAPRIPGTANALSVTGVLLLIVAAGFLLSSQASGPPWARALGVGAAACVGVAAGYRQARRQPAAAVVTSSMFAGLATATLTFAPMLPPGGDGVGSGWWASGALLLSGVVMVGLELARTRVATPAVPWAGLGTTALVLGVFAAAATAGEQVSSADGAVPVGVLAGAVMLGGSLALVALEGTLRPRRWSPLLGAGALVAVSGFLLLGALGDPESRWWYAGLAAAIAIVLGTLAVRLEARGHDPGRNEPHPRSVLAAGAARVAAATGGVAVALVAATGTGPPALLCSGGAEGESCVDGAPATTAWLEALHPWWSGALVGVSASVVAGIVVVLLRRTGQQAADVPLVASGSVVLGWIVLVLSDSLQRGADPSAVNPAVAAALVVGGLGTLLVLAVVRWPLWTLWSAALTATAGMPLAWAAAMPVERPLGPELLGALLAAPLVVAGYLTRRRLGPTTSTWATVAPALSVGLAPSVLAVLGGTLDRAFGSDPVELDAVLREVLVLAAGVVFAVVGARRRWAGVFWPGIATVALVVGVQVLELSSQVPQWVWLSVAGAILMLVGARWEWARRQGHRTREWSATLR